MTWVPKFTLWSSDGLTLLYTFVAVQDTNLPQTPTDNVVITNFRSAGAIVIGGGLKPFEANISFWLTGGSYEEVIGLIDTLVTTIPTNTPFLLRVDKTPSTYYQYPIKRIQEFEWTGVSRDFRNYRQEVNLKLLANAW